MSSIGADMRIGELARRSGVASTALRYYEKAGLLPESRRSASGYRTYHPDAVPHRAEVRSRIRELQRLGRDLDRLASQGAGIDPSQCDPAGVCKVIQAV